MSTRDEHKHSHGSTCDHDHGGGHRGHHHVPSDSRKLGWAIVLTGTIFVAQVVGGIYSNSLALLSDAGHMLTDVAALLLSLFAIRLAARPFKDVSNQYTFGLRRAEMLAALANGVTLLVICVYIVIEAIERFSAPQDILPIPMLIVAGIGLVANIIAAWLLHGSVSINTRSAYLHVMTDLLSSVGVVVGGLIVLYTGAQWVDTALSLLISVIIFKSAIGVVRETIRVFMEAAPGHVDVEAVQHTIADVKNVVGVHDLHIWQPAGEEVALSAHVVVESLQYGDVVLNAVQQEVARLYNIHHTTFQLESKNYSKKCGSCEYQVDDAQMA